ncbi:MAG: pyridoxal phosphate-dependent aminotransferase [Erysipelotrichales bacterium]|nr:pyridoxal phosphate-dependent aminotransferase [Erysipelotrichales bacterium]
MFKRSKLEEWYEGKNPEYDISECGMVNTINLNQLTDFGKYQSLNILSDYGNSNGEMCLINSICNIYGCNSENVLITNGASEALFILLSVLCDGRSEITCQFPYYYPIESFFNRIECDIKWFVPELDLQFGFDIEKFKKVFSGNSDVALLNFPNNPTGIELNDNDYANIIDYAERTKKIVIFDEVTALSVNKTYIERNIHYHLDNCVCINSMSKAYGIPGLRVGWIIANKTTIKRCQIIKELISICTSPVLQKISYDILKYRHYIINNNRKIVLHNINSLVRLINRYNFFLSINCIPQNCSFCLVKNHGRIIRDYEFCTKLYESYDVLITPGACFGLEGCFRIGLGINPDSFNNAINRMTAFINDCYRL